MQVLQFHENRKHICLTGMSGVGKTWVGEELASRLGLPWIDTDHLIENQLGIRVNDVFNIHGEEYFRGIEEKVLNSALMCKLPSVISLGGGSIVNERNRSLIQTKSLLVYLRATRTTLFDYLKNDTPRPKLEGDLQARIGQVLEERDPLYSEASQIIIDTDGKDASMISMEIIEEIPNYIGIGYLYPNASEGL